MKRVLAISLTLLACSSEANDLCELTTAKATKTVKIHGVPGYFFKVHPDGDYLTFIEAEHNTLLDLNSGKEHKTIGYIDPVWSPDGKFLTHPGNNGITFLHGQEIIDRTLEGKPDEARTYESKHMGVYQSIGKSGDTYKMVSDQDGVSISEYGFGDNGPEGMTEVKRPCENIPNMATDLPMISKDGRFLSVYDRESKSTKIYKFKGKDCDLSMDLGYGTGKVSFNKDSSQIAFHIDQFSEFEDGYFSGVGKDKIKNVMVMNLDETPEGKLEPVSWALASQNIKPGNGGYYPDFDKNGNIYFIEDIGNNFQFVKVAQDKLEFRDTESDLVFGKKNCDEVQAPSAPVLLSQMWKDICGKEKMPGAELVMAIDSKACKEMVEKNWLPTLGMSKEKLLSTCPQIEDTGHENIGEWDPNQIASGEALIKNKCMACHRTKKTFDTTAYITVQTGPDSWGEDEQMTYKKKMNAFNLSNLDFETAAQMISAIRGRQMPKNEPMNAEDQKKALDFLQKKMLDLDQNWSNDYESVRRYSEENLEVERQNILSQFPTQSGDFKDRMITMVNCVYGQRDCNKYIELERPGIEAAASEVPEEEREAYIAHKIMGLRCKNLFEVTPQDCKDWDKKENR